MAENQVLISLVKPAMEELGRFVVGKIKHLFTYLCCFNNNIQGLRNEAQRLEDARVGLQRQVEASENNAEVILPKVWTWLEDASEKIEVNKKRIVDDIPTVKNDCWSVKSRYQLSRKAVKLTGVMKQLMEERSKITDISTPALPAAQAEIPIGTTYDFQSREQIEEGIMETLEAKEVTTMGICGMGGVGKTTMAKRIMVRVKEKKIFQEILMVVVSKQVDGMKIQGAIAESLGLELREETLLARATKLSARLTGTKRILIVFDDVWEELKLEDLGIPCGNEGCTILFTSRNKDVLEKMDVQKVDGVEILCDTESWFLFKEKVGACVEDPNLFPTAENVARECKGLPIALITVAGALKDKTSITYWEDALQQLQSFDLEDMQDVIKDVYKPLKLSYSKLESKHAKSLFLLCSLFPEDEDISLEELTSYCLGLRMFPNFDFSNASEGILKKVRRRVFTIVDTLKSRFLLLNGEDEHHVRMHDVVRDVAIYIAKHEAKEGIVDVKFNSLHSSVTCRWVSVFPEETSSLLRMHGLHWDENFEKKDFSIFEGINSQLKLLSLEFISLKSIPLDIQFLKNLRTLRLEYCTLESFSVVGELLSLEILYCPHCKGIEELPVELGNLNQLKLLDFTHCRSLKRIPPGVVSNLVELEEFKMLDSFGGWELTPAAAEVQGQERRNACLNEFEKLSKLTCLEIEIEDFNLAGEEIHFSPKIVRHRIRIGNIFYIQLDDTSHAKGMCAQLSSDINLGSWVIRFLRSSDRLDLEGNCLRSLDLPQAHNMKSLTIEDCCTDEELKLLSLESIFLKSSIPLDIQFLKNLRTLRLEYCNLESLSVVGELLSLEILYCPWCEGIEELPVELGNLNQLKLLDFTYCRSLKRIPPGVVSNLVELEEFKMLGSFGGWELAGATGDVQGQERRNACLSEFEKLSKLTCLEIQIEDFNLAGEEIRFSPNIVRHRISIGDNGYLLLDYTPKSMCVRLPRDINLGSWVLRFLRSSDKLDLKGNGLKSLDLPQAHNMKSLRIEDCCTDKELVNSSATSNDDLSKFDVFPILESLKLKNLPNLEEIYDGPALRHLWKTRPNRNIVSFDMLREIEIEKCINIHNLFSFLTSVRTDRYFDELLCTQKAFFPMLVNLNLWGLDKLEVIWNFSIPDESDSFRSPRELTLFQNLKTVRLVDLPVMTHLWKSPNIRVSLSNLTKVCISRCPKLCSLFSCTMPMEFLSQLVELEIDTCAMMEQVLLNEENENEGNQCRTIKFSKLSKLKFFLLQSLTAFGKGFETIEFPMLEDMTIDCPKLISFLSSNGNNQIQIDGHDDDTFHLFCNQKISFDSLKRISIWKNGKRRIWCHQIPPSFFTQIAELGISFCSGVRSLFSFSIAIKLVNLKKLDIFECKEMEKLIEDDEHMVTESIIFPMLEDMEIKNCPKLMNLISATEKNRNPTDNHGDDNFHLFCSNKISFRSLKRVSISYPGKGNWCRQTPDGLFRQLEELEIKSCHATSLFSFSIAKNLVNIKKLNIGRCNEMEKVIENDEEILCEKPRTLFPSLKELNLLFLPKLECLCNWRCDLHLPLLEKVFIFECPLLEFFTMKSVTTPKLKRIQLDRAEKEVGDLNDTIKLYFETNQQQLISAKEASTSTEASEVEADHEISKIEEEEIEQALDN